MINPLSTSRVALTPFINQGEVSGEYIVNLGTPLQLIDILSNTLSTDIVSIDFVKAVSQTNVVVGETISYTLTITNNSTLELTNLLVKDTDISPFLNISNISLNGTAVSVGQDLNSGVLIPSLISGATSTITFDATVLSGAPDLLSNTATMSYDYGTQSDSQDSNQVDVNLITANMSVVKTADKSVVTTDGEILEYTLTINNTGNVLISSLVLVDIIPNGMTYVQGSTIIGSNPAIDANPQSGISIPDLDIGESQTVKFSVTVSI